MAGWAASLPVRVDLFVEDPAHERFAQALVRRLADQSPLACQIQSRVAEGGHGRVLTELRAFQKALRGGVIPGGAPDLLVVLLDSDCEGHQRVRTTVLQLIDPGLFAHVAVGCPDPHVERWYMADPDSAARTLGLSGMGIGYECEPGYYKGLLSQWLADAGYPVTQGGSEYAPDLVEAMNLARAGRDDPSLATLIRDVRGAFRLMARSAEEDGAPLA